MREEFNFGDLMTRVSLFFAAAAVTFAATVAPMSCSEAPKVCSASTCDGCCDTNGACQFGTTTLACGGKGTTCRSCQSTDVCTDGLCLLPSTVDAGGGTTTCNEGNCAGCCKGDACVSGAEITGCGKGGGVCEVCNGNQACTSAGRCQNATCLGCIDVSGACQAGTSTTACGNQGYICLSCISGATCNASGLCTGGTCDGCVDGQGVCRAGTSKSSCGNTGSTCVACKASEQCTADGVCVPTAAPDAGTGSCNATNCPDGCCSGNACINRTNTVQCGKGGAACASCSSKQTCVAGECTACSGCVDANSGLCTSGTTNTSCGKAGNICQTCKTSNGQTCVNGSCQGGTCNASNCPTGCCDGASCVLPANQTQFQCGSGTAGTACVSCASSCDTSAGQCRDERSDAGTFDPDGGFPSFDCNIDAGVFCKPGSCCGSFLGFSLCVTAGSSVIIGEACGSVGACSICNVGTTCNLNSYTCQ